MIVSLSIIDADPANNLRIGMDSEKLADLTESISRDGLLQPLVVAQRGERYRLVAGFRRFRAVQFLGWTEAPIAIVEGDDATLMRFCLMENLARADLSVLEEAIALRKMFGALPIRQIATEIGRSPNFVLQRRQLLELPEDIQVKFADGSIPISKVSAVRRARDRQKAVETILHNRLRKSNRDYRAVTRQKRRTIREIRAMTARILENGLEGLASVALAWASGRHTDDVLISYIEKEAAKHV